jgi:hypothetical protein
MNASTESVSPQTESAMHRALRAELETTRQAFHALLATLTPADWDRPSHNPRWTIGEVLWHITLYLFVIPEQLIWLQGNNFPEPFTESADELNEGNVEQTREARTSRPSSQSPKPTRMAMRRPSRRWRAFVTTNGRSGCGCRIWGRRSPASFVRLKRSFDITRGTLPNMRPKFQLGRDICRAQRICDSRLGRPHITRFHPQQQLATARGAEAILNRGQTVLHPPRFFLPGRTRTLYLAATLIERGRDEGAERQAITPGLKWSPWCCWSLSPLPSGSSAGRKPHSSERPNLRLYPDLADRFMPAHAATLARGWGAQRWRPRGGSAPRTSRAKLPARYR